MKCGHVKADGDAPGVSLCLCVFKTVLTCAHTQLSSGRQSRLGADAAFFINLILPQMNQRLWKFCFV